ncbi:MAG: hypothetical protein Hens2KO_22120 [Henriciella sp.]
MISSVRYAIGVGLPVLAAGLGFLLTSAPAHDGLEQRLAAWPKTSVPADYSNSIDRIIGELSGMYLFGHGLDDPLLAAAADAQNGQIDDKRLTGVSLIAVASLDKTPTAILDDATGAITSVSVGETVAEYWTVQSIDSDTIVVLRDDEFTTISLESAISGN